MVGICGRAGPVGLQDLHDPWHEQQENWEASQRGYGTDDVTEARDFEPDQ